MSRQSKYFDFTTEKVIILLTFLSTLKRSEIYNNQTHGHKGIKLKEQLDDLKNNSAILFSDLSITTYKDKLNGVLKAINEIYQVERHTNSVKCIYDNWDELYENLPFNVKFPNQLDRDRVHNLLTSIATNMAQIDTTPIEKKERNKLQEARLKSRKAEKGKNALETLGLTGKKRKLTELQKITDNGQSNSRG